VNLTGARWLAQEIAEQKYINCQLEAAKLGIRSLCSKEEDVHIQ